MGKGFTRKEQHYRETGYDFKEVDQLQIQETGDDSFQEPEHTDYKLDTEPQEQKQKQNAKLKLSEQLL